MNSTELYKLKYPIGKFIKPNRIGSELLNVWIEDIELFPSKLNSICQNLSADQLQWKYRPGGWSIKQVVHHCVDSHINSIIRFKWTLTEDTPTIKPYYEDRWAELSDSQSDNIQTSLLLLKALHEKWVYLLKNLSEMDLDKEFIHPDHGNNVSLRENIGIYAWHCKHHLEHIKLAIKFEGTFN